MHEHIVFCSLSQWDGWEEKSGQFRSLPRSYSASDKKIRLTLFCWVHFGVTRRTAPHGSEENKHLDICLKTWISACGFYLEMTSVFIVFIKTSLDYRFWKDKPLRYSLTIHPCSPLHNCILIHQRKLYDKLNTS